MADVSLDSTALPEETTQCKVASRDYFAEDELTRSTENGKGRDRFVLETEVTRLHKLYARQIDTLESIIQDKEVQIRQYQQTVADQTCELANLKEELGYLKSRDVRQADPQERTALLEAMCEVKLDQMHCRIQPAIVQINLSIGRLVSLQNEVQSSDAEVYACLNEPGDGSFASSVQETAVQNSARLHDTAFQLSKREMSKSQILEEDEIEEPLSPLGRPECEKCEHFWSKLSKLHKENRKHKDFISTLKRTLETIVSGKSKRL